MPDPNGTIVTAQATGNGGGGGSAAQQVPLPLLAFACTACPAHALCDGGGRAPRNAENWYLVNATDGSGLVTAVSCPLGYCR